MSVVRSGSASHVGRVRSVNQDVALETPALFAVADGMGGHVGGEVAARVAVETLQAAFTRQPSTKGLQEALRAANSAVWQESQDRTDLHGMGTTMVAAAVVPGADGRDVVALANVGDSRGYLYSGGDLHQVTVDHSLAEEKVRLGELTEAEAAVHPHRHILTRALGSAPAVDVDLWEVRVHSGDRILLCSDGLTNEVGVAEIAEVLGTVADPQEVARILVGSANRHGGSDNVTIVVVDVLVGEEGGPSSWVVAPLGTAPLREAPPGVDPSVGAPRGGPDGTLPGGPVPTAPRPAGDPGAEDVFVRAHGGSRPAAPQGASGAGAATLVGAPPTEAAPGASRGTGAHEGWRARRRRLGVPRMITFRVFGFLVLAAAILAAGYAFVRWYALTNWYVTVDQGQLVVYQGRPGGILWFHPKVVDRTGVTTSEVLPIHLAALDADVEEPSLAAARRYVSNLHAEYLSLHPPASSTGGSTAPSIGPAGTIPTIPPTTTTTAPPSSSTSSSTAGSSPRSAPTSTPPASGAPARHGGASIGSLGA